MLETKEQKQVFAGCITLIIILGLVSFWNKPNFSFVDNTNYQAANNSYTKQQEAYNKYLASIDTTPATQEKMFKEIVPEAEIKAAVAQQLQTDQKIVMPEIADKQIKISNAKGKVALQKYLSQSAPIFDKLQAVTDSATGDIYNPAGDPNKIDSLLADVSSAIADYEKIAVPKEAVTFHKQLIVGLGSYKDLLSLSKDYMASSTSNPWPETYKNYSIIAQSNQIAGDSFQQLNQKYNLLGDSEQTPGNFLIPAANAQLATVDIWAKAQSVLNEVAATAIARYMLGFLDQLTKKIEAAYRVSNFLYYSDALVSGQYADDYLNKYVADPLDRVMVKNFIPQVNCGNSKDYSSAFKAKADQYLGFDPNGLDPKDPNYYTKLAKVGDFMSQPNGWELYYKGIASQAQGAAEKAAGNELTSPGLKTARDPSGNIITPVEVSLGVMRAAFQRYLSEGRSDQQSTVVERITGQITQQFLNSFVFQGVVLQEQKTCISVPQVNLLSGVQLVTAP